MSNILKPTVIYSGIACIDCEASGCQRATKMCCACQILKDEDKPCIVCLTQAPDVYYPDFVYANGDQICTICNKEYRKHPFDSRALSYMEEPPIPFLHLRCDGMRLKL